jgi:DNA-binding CsgD family transcriptional regulator
VLAVVAGIFGLNAYRLRVKQQKQAAQLLEQKNQLIQTQLESQQLKEEQQRRALERAEMERKLQQRELENLQQAYESNKRELDNLTLNIVARSEALDQQREYLQEALQKANQNGTRQLLQNALQVIDKKADREEDWETLKRYFDQVHEGFWDRLQHHYPGLSPNERKLCAYLRMNLSIKEVASLLHVTPKAVEMSRYRMRNKMGLRRQDNLVDIIQSI